MNPDAPELENLFWEAEENGANIDINIAIYPVPVKPHLLWYYSRPGTALPN